MPSRPKIVRAVQLKDALHDLPERSLFHAGPPYQGAAPGAVLNAAAQVAVAEGWAATTDAAMRQLEGSNPAITLRPAQDNGLVVPLAQVASPSTWCFEVGDGAHFVYSPVSEGGPPALRFGSADPACRERATNWCAKLAEQINPLLDRKEIHPDALMLEALRDGDDGHAIVQAGTRLLVDAFDGLPESTREEVLSNPGFALTVWMAYCSWKLRSGDSIAAIGGNGIDFGVRMHGEEEWNTIPAPPPAGPYFKPELADKALGGIGDSAVVDACGFGGQALLHAPVLLEQWREYLPPDAVDRGPKLLNRETGCLDLARIQESGLPPIINLAILHRDGADLPIGRGHYCPPVTLFQPKG